MGAHLRDRGGCVIRVIGGSLRGRRLATPRTASVRPTASRVREAIADILQGELPGARVLDLFAGSGAMGIEALSRGATHATFVERARDAIAALERNVAELGLREQSRLVATEALQALARLSAERQRFDVVFLDPPYADEPTELLTRLRAAAILAPGGPAVLELARRRRLEPPAGWSCDRRHYGDTELLILRSVEDPGCL